MMSVGIENISERVISVRAVRLKMPWSDANFQWQSAKDLNEWDDYVVPELGTYGFNPSVVLNHRLHRDLKLFPSDSIEGFLLGTGTTSIPDDYAHRQLVQMQLVIYTTLNQSYGGWIELGVDRGAQRETHKLQECGAARKRPRVPLFTAKDMKIAD